MNSKDDAPAGRNPAKGERKTAQDKYTTKDQFGPVEKVRLLALAASMADLTRSELATLNVLADMINAGTGQAWPSFKTLAARTGITPRSAKRAIRQLIDRKPPLVILARPGDRVRSNRYELNRAYFAELDALGGSDARDTTVVTCVASSGDVEDQKVVTHVSHESIPESEHKAKDEGNRSGTDGAAPDRPRGPPGLPQSGDRFPEFWEAMGWRRTTVADAEQLLAEALEAGTDYHEVIEGAKRYKSYCDATGGKMKSTAAAWLKREAWRDGWELPAERVAKASNEARKSVTHLNTENKHHFTKTGKPKRRVRAVFTSWDLKKREAMNSWNRAETQFGNHFGRCSVCSRGSIDYENYCNDGKVLVDQLRGAREAFSQWEKNNEPPKRWEIWSPEANNWVVDE